MRLYLILFVVAITTSGIGYWYYKDSQAKIFDLVEKNAALASANSINRAAIQQLEKDADETQKRMTKLQENLKEAESYIGDLRKLFMEHNLTLLAEEKPGLIEKRINDATEEIFDSISGTTRTR